MMITLKRTLTPTQDFKNLTTEFKSSNVDSTFDLNTIELLKHYVVAYKNNIAVGCGAFFIENSKTVEIKFIYVQAEYKELPVSELILKDLILWAKQLCFEKVIVKSINGIEEVVTF